MRANLAIPAIGAPHTWAGRLRAGARSGPAPLLAATAVGAALGLLFWAAAARLLPVGALGRMAALVSATTLIATAANLGLSAVVVRYLPIAGASSRRLCLAATLLPGLLAAAGGALLPLLPVGGALFAPGAVGGAPALAALLAAATAVGMVQDSVAIARGRTWLVLARSASAGALRVGLLLALAGLGEPALALAWTAGALASVTLGAGCWLARPDAGPPLGVPVRRLAAYSGAQYVTGLLTQAPAQLYPVLVAAYVSAEAAGAFGFAWMTTSLVLALPPAAANVLLSRLAREPEGYEGRLGRSVAQVTAATAALGLVAGGAVFALAGLLLPAAPAALREMLPLALAGAVPFAAVRMQMVELSLRERLRPMLLLSGSVALAGVALPLALVQRWGVVGLELGWVLGQLVGVLVAPAVRRGARQESKMLDFWVALGALGLAEGLALRWGGTPAIAALLTAAGLIWPGYLLGAALWPDDGRLDLGWRLALMPLLSLLLSVAMALGCWWLLPGSSAAMVRQLTLLAAAPLAGGAALRRRGRAGPGQTRTLAGALALFVVAAVVIGALAGAGPTPDLAVGSPAAAAPGPDRP